MDQPALTDTLREKRIDYDHQKEMFMDAAEDLMKQVSSPDLMKEAMNLGVMRELSVLRRSIIKMNIWASFREIISDLDFNKQWTIITRCQNMLRKVFLLDQVPSQQQQKEEEEEGQPHRRRRRQQYWKHKIWRFMMSHINPARSSCITRRDFRRMVNNITVYDDNECRRWALFETSRRPELMNFEDDLTEKWVGRELIIMSGVDWELYLEDATLDIVRRLLTGSYATQVITICSPAAEPPGDQININAALLLMTELITQRIFIQDWRVNTYFLRKERIRVKKLFNISDLFNLSRYERKRFLLILEDDDDVPDDLDAERWNSLLQQCKKYLTLGSRILVTTRNKTLAEKIAGSSTVVRPYYLPPVVLKDHQHENLLLLEDQKNINDHQWFSNYKTSRPADWAGKRLLHFYCSLMLPHDHHTLCEEDLFDLFFAMGFLIIPSQLYSSKAESIRNQYLEGLKDVLEDFPKLKRESMHHREEEETTHYRIINSEDMNQRDWWHGTFRRYLSINNFPHDVDEGYIFQMLGSQKRQELLSVLIFTTDVKYSSKNFKISKKVPRDLSSTCKNLRVLSLQGSGIKSLPECLCTLFSLRYLNLSRTRIKTLPKSIGNLHNLQTLNLSHCRCLRVLPESISNLLSLQKLDLECCYRLSKLPDGLSNMISLERLITQGCYSLSNMPSDMGIMYNLVILSNYIFGEDTRGISNLKIFYNFHGTLHIENLNFVKGPVEAQQARLMSKNRLQSLVLHWNLEDMEADATERSNVQNSVLQKLQPSSNLQSLKIISYTGTRFPPWMMNDIESDLQHLVEIRLINLKTCVSLPPLGMLQNLKVVEISGMDAIKSLDEDFCKENAGTFPALEKLTISQMPNLEKWSTIAEISTDGASKVVLFPHLTHLNIIQCPKLEMLPSHLPSVKELALWMNNEKLYSPAESLKFMSSGRSLTKLSIYFVQDYLFSFSMFQGLKESTALEIEIFECMPMHNLLSGMKCLSEVQKLTLISCDNLERCAKWLEKSTFIQPLCVLDCPSYS